MKLVPGSAFPQVLCIHPSAAGAVAAVSYSGRCILPVNCPGQQGTALPKVMPSPGGGHNFTSAGIERPGSLASVCTIIKGHPRSRAPGLVVASIRDHFPLLASYTFLASSQGYLQRPQPNKCMHLRVTFLGALSKKHSSSA